MYSFNKLLVGVDIDTDGSLAEGSRAAVDHALRVASRHGAELVFAHAINLPDDQRQVLALQPQSSLAKFQRLVDAALSRLVREAQEQGLRANGRLLSGEGWRALIGEVQQQGCDLVIVGTRRHNISGRSLFGSTGNRLLRHCPCPVWCVKSMGNPVRAILVADDLSDTGRTALDLGAVMASQLAVPLHVLHVLELPEERLLFGSLSAAELEEQQQEKLERIQARISTLGDHALSAVHISVCPGTAYACILDYLRNHPVDLLCMGTVARSGLRGLITGNTAENVLPWVECSLLAVKPAGFRSPVAKPLEHDIPSPKYNAR